MVIFIALAIFFVLLFILLYVPIKIKIDVNIKYDEKKKKIVVLPDTPNNFLIYFSKYIKIYELKVKRVKNTFNKFEEKFEKDISFRNVLIKIFKKGYIDRFTLSLGFDLGDYILDSYINAMLNTVICMYVNSNQKDFNLKNFYYQIYISENLFILNFSCIFSLKTVDTIKVIIDERRKVAKEKIEINEYEKRSDIYGRTSN